MTEKYEDRLETIFEMQKELAQMMKQDRYPRETEAKVSAVCTTIIHEDVELQTWTNSR